MSPSGRRVSATARTALAAVLACSVAFAPLSASAVIDRGLGEILEAVPGMAEATPQVVTSDGWYDATDPETPDTIVLANVETEESFELPADAQLIGFTDDWAVWSSESGEVQFRSMADPTVGSLDLEYSGQDAVIDGDRFVVAEPEFDEDGAAVVSYPLTGGESTSIAYAASDLGTGLCADGDWAAWAEPVGEGETPDSWDVVAWNMATGETVTVAEGIVLGEDESLAETLQLSGDHVLWSGPDGAHVFDLTTQTERTVVAHPDEVTLTGDWVAWTATPPHGADGVDDVFALDLAAPAGSTSPVNVTASVVGEWGLVGADGWAVFQTPDAAGNPGVVTAVDLATKANMQVSDPEDPSSMIAGIDGHRVSWISYTGDDESDSYSLCARALGLPGPELKGRYTSETADCVVSWAPVPGAEGFEYRIGDDGPVQSTAGTSITVHGLTSDAPIPVYVWSVLGDVKSEPSDTFVAIAATSKLTLSTRASLVDLDDDVHFTTGLTAGGDDLTDSLVWLECSANGVNGWSDVVDSEGTISDGTADLVASATRTLYYRAYFEGDEEHSEAYSPAVKVAARAVVGTPHFASTVKKSRKTTASGVVRPDLFVHPTNSVTVYAYHREGSHWRLRAKATAVTSFDVTDSTSSYSVRLSLSRTGKWRLQAVYKGTSIAAKDSSGYRKVTVK